MTLTSRVQKLETMTFEVPVIQDDIDHSDCLAPHKCMIKVAMERALRKISKSSNHHCRVDAGHATFHWQGYRYIADMPKIGKANLIKFDAEDKARKKAKKAGEKYVSVVKPFKLKFKARKISKLPANTAARREQVNKARRLRVAGGEKPKVYTLRHRVAGFA
jgi:hypothetical protein